MTFELKVQIISDSHVHGLIVEKTMLIEVIPVG